LSVEFISSCVGWECYPGFKWYFVYSGWCYWKWCYVRFGYDVGWKEFGGDVGLVHEGKRIRDEDCVCGRWLGGLHVWNNNNKLKCIFSIGDRR
jgi:hypothetical protein